MSVHEIDDLIIHLVGRGPPGAYRARRAVLEMVSHQLASDPAQRLLDRRYLGKDVGAVAILDDHFLKSANLPLNAAEAFQISSFYVRIDAERFARAG